ncbi:MAG: iron-sulfur cluster assembly accessory protein [Candidatus Thalassarchaeaceae archaeon]|jgi:iron-sulfur cluster assembly protein|nr:iron-sulfur cluster assembly accessory protein [Candidatus Thalassarchaeaceae archaeon]MDP6844490.1 iron-sulfur cluster assembly accessory protein [Candidatus Thalassarchaeaceae archaeon]HJM30542.1 iron-sulfur cluster assembly accessory protein [Candidatus Thalassarchaeaceae archaeon]
MEAEDCGNTFALPMANEIEVVSVTLDVTEGALAAMSGAMSGAENDDVLVISVLGGGCSGFMYDMQIQSRPEGNGWQFISCDGITIAIHDKDSKQLSGITLDYVNSLMGGGFKVINPNAEKSCGCGKSFR